MADLAPTGLATPRQGVGRSTGRPAPRPSASASDPHRRRQRRDASALARGQRRLFLPFVSAALLLYTLFFILPALYSAYASFTEWDGINAPQGNGLDNFKALLNDPVFRTTFTNTLLVLFVVGGTIFALSFGFLLVLREMRGNRFVRSVIFLPHVVSTIVLAIFWGYLLRYDGLVNNALGTVGVEPVKWIGPKSAFPAIMVGLVWINIGYYVMILMAGVDRIPAYYYEDAMLAGANAWQKLRHVTLPLSWDIVGVAAVLWTISSVKIFEFNYAFGAAGGYPPPAYEWTAAVFVYAQTVGNNPPPYRFGYACASAIVMLLLVVFFVVALRRLMRRETIEF
ncbi:carbohydrate ABC transporter permease [Micromonospora mirobrigensis]|uniref:Carbohydrate ABC transporter membrane protein 1, CUT1 family n=1 Tax=Micromonospora mirobrigensis TaxID=262898 RepID=A0A1C5AKL1_9ACTN|nr:sugar ABC transporter permease [Micromonospora mirobrigensis]SCF45739.1 carbohydrate ABC transporter membrane protein 1, CUT1 family [Micromonospora mirobrigensis]